MRGVSKAFGDFHALKDVTLDVADGEFLAVLGPSGCGKTTLLRMVAGFEAGSAGTIAIGERPVFGPGENVPPEKRRVGIVFQNYALWPHMTVAQNVGFALKVAKVEKGEAKRRVDDALALVNLQGFGERYPANLSGGQRQRVALARCLVAAPSLVLFDEPLANLDVHLRAAMEDEFARFHERTGTTMVYITHDQAEAMALGDRIIVMDRGRIAQAGTPQQIYRAPANAFVADFIGTMNRLPAALEGNAWRVPGGLVPCAADVANVAAAQNAELLFRPEDVALARPEDAHLGGAVVTALFLGNYTRLLVDVGAPAPLVVDTTRRDGWHPGDRVGLRLDTGHLITLAQARAA